VGQANAVELAVDEVGEVRGGEGFEFGGVGDAGFEVVVEAELEGGVERDLAAAQIALFDADSVECLAVERGWSVFSVALGEVGQGLLNGGEQVFGGGWVRERCALRWA